MPMSLFGPLTGTNNAVSSGAHFTREAKAPAVVEDPGSSAHRQIARNRTAERRAVDALKAGRPDA